MIFINRRRMLNNKIIKDPSKYWYVEKYVYGVLKETVEVALGSGTTFGSIDSGVEGDTFYGWSINSTSTKSTFNATTTYKNTVAIVKNNLDAENTLKIYAIYKYTELTSTSSTSKVSTTSHAKLVVSRTGTAIFGGYYKSISGESSQSSSPTEYYSSTSLAGRAYINSDPVTGTVNTGNGNTTTIRAKVNEGDIIELNGQYDDNSHPISHGTYVDIYMHCVECTVPHYTTKTSYRVEYNIEGITKPPIG